MIVGAPGLGACGQTSSQLLGASQGGRQRPTILPRERRHASHATRLQCAGTSIRPRCRGPGGRLGVCRLHGAPGSLRGGG